MRDLLQIIDYDKNQLSYALANALKERDEAREELRTAVQERHDFHWELIDAIRERDEARNAIVGLENKWKCAIEMAARAEIERDDALAELDNMQNQRDFAMKVIHRLENERDELNKFGEEFSALAWKLEGERNEARRELKLALEQSELCIEMSKK